MFEETRSHVRARIRERYGIDVAAETLAEYITQGRAALKGFGSPGTGRLIYAVPICGKVVNCLYQPNARPGIAGDIITVLPPELGWERKRAARREQQKRVGQAAKQFFRGLKNQADDDDLDY